MNESSLPQVVRADGMPAGTPELAVVIVGAGACGLTTGIALRRAGVDCVILERDARATGSTALSSGFIPAAETVLQKSLGIEDTHEMLVEDIVNKAHGQAPRPLVQAYVEAVTEALDALQAYGLPFEIVDGFLYPGHRVRRMHSMPEKTGETSSRGWSNWPWPRGWISCLRPWCASFGSMPISVFWVWATSDPMGRWSTWPAGS